MTVTFCAQGAIPKYALHEFIIPKVWVSSSVAGQSTKMSSTDSLSLADWMLAYANSIEGSAAVLSSEAFVFP